MWPVLNANLAFVAEQQGENNLTGCPQPEEMRNNEQTATIKIE